MQKGAFGQGDRLLDDGSQHKQRMDVREKRCNVLWKYRGITGLQNATLGVEGVELTLSLDPKFNLCPTRIPCPTAMHRWRKAEPETMIIT